MGKVPTTTETSGKMSPPVNIRKKYSQAMDIIELREEDKELLETI